MSDRCMGFWEGGDCDDVFDFPSADTRRQFLKKISATSVALAIGPTLLSIPGIAVAQNSPASKESAVDVVRLTLRINGQERAVDVDPRTTLLDLLREQLHLTGSKKGCDHGQCGACTVLANGRRINSCLSLALMHEGDEITTIEGLAN